MTAELKLKLEQRVQIRAGRRIRNLRVEVSRERIVLRGQTDTYYAKQMAQHGVRDLLPEAHLENAITVGN
jgi:osmotically-inducible protein OsmY